MFLLFIHSLSQQIFLGFLLGVLCNDLYKIEVHIRNVSVFQDLVGRGYKAYMQKGRYGTTKSSHIMVQ